MSLGFDWLIVKCILTALIKIPFMYLFIKSLQSSNIVGNICESLDISVANINRLPIDLKFRGTINHISSLKRQLFTMQTNSTKSCFLAVTRIPMDPNKERILRCNVNNIYNNIEILKEEKPREGQQKQSCIPVVTIVSL